MTLGSAPQRGVRTIAIVGGGTAGWVTASILARALQGLECRITVVESAEIATVGVGEATIPPFIDLLQFLGIDEGDFVRHTQATYKLGIRFDDWRRPGERYWHPFGVFGAPIARRPFFHAWHKAQREGGALVLADYSPCARLGQAGRVLRGAAAAAAGVRHALHFDAGLVARYLAAYAQALGVRRIESTVQGVSRRDDGFLEALLLKDGPPVEADLFIDCSGFRSLLLGQTLKVGWQDWSDLLPCDRAVAAPTQATAGRAPYTVAAARPAGWRWRIPLQHRTGNGYVYCSGAVSDADALDDLMAGVEGPPLAEPRVLRFGAGRRRVFWEKNCVAIGLASGFLEPLESTSIHLAIRGVMNLLERFPDLDFDANNISAYNDEVIAETEGVRDFIVLHYILSERSDTPFWQAVGAIQPPDSLSARLAAYRATGRVNSRANELFTDLSWFYVLEGMGVRPAAYDPLMDVVSPPRLSVMLSDIRRDVEAECRAGEPHDHVLGLGARGS